MMRSGAVLSRMWIVLHFHEGKESAQLDPSAATLVQILFNGSTHCSEEIGLHICERLDLFCDKSARFCPVYQGTHQPSL